MGSPAGFRMLQDFTVEHGEPEVIAWALRHVLDWGVVLDGYFVCPTLPVVPHDDFPSHTVGCYRRHHGQPQIDPAQPLSGHIAAVGVCNCLGSGASHSRYGTAEELSAAVLDTLRDADPGDFLRAAGTDGPFHGTDASVQVGYRLHYCSWHRWGLWLSFRHIYVGK